MAGTKIGIRPVMQRVSILMIMLITVETLLVSPALADIAKAFPDAAGSAIGMIMTMPFIPMVIMAAFITPQLAKKFDKKTLILVACVVYIFAGTAGAYLNDSVGQLILMRAVLGIPLGITGPLCIAIINQLYTGLERKNMFGFANAVSSLLSIFLLLFAGWLAAQSWKYVFLSYLLFIIVLLLLAIFLPKLPAQVEEEGASGKTKIVYTPKQKAKLTFVVLFAFAGLMCSFVIQVQTSFIVDEKGLGGAQLAALVISVFGIGQIISGFLYGVYSLIFKRFCLVLLPALIALGCYIMFLATNVPMLIIGILVAGIGAGINNPLVNDKVTAIGPIQNGAFAGGLIMAATGIGVFLSVFMIDFYALFVEPTAVNLIWCTVVMHIIITAIVLVYVLWNPFKGVNYVREDEQSIDTPSS